MKRFLGLVVTLVMLLGCANAESVTSAKDIVVLFTSDTHCGVDNGFGYVGVTAIRDQMLSKGNHVVLVDNGDAIQGEPVGTLTTGSAIIELMNTVGYDVAIPGNHEFDYGMDRFLELVKLAKYPYISCNFNKEGETVFDPYIIKDFDGVKVAFIGVTTPHTITSSAPKYFQNEAGEFIYGFSQDENGEKLYTAVQTAVDSARAEGANYVIVMGHLGSESSNAPYTYADIISNTSGIDALLDGHSHDTDQVVMKNKNGKDVHRSACGTKLEGVGYLRISAKDGSITCGLYSWNNDISAPELLGLKNDVNAAVERATSLLNAKLSEVVAHTAVDLTINDPVAVDAEGKPIRIIRNAETNLGDLCADAYRAMGGADVAFVNGGGIRVSIPAGDITLNDILKVHPFGNALCVVEVTGQQILDALEWGSRVVPDQNGGFLQVSGLTYEIHTYIESSCTQNDEGLFTGVSGAYRVKSVKIGGEDIDLAKTYTLASHNYMIKDCGDGFTMFKDNKVLLDEIMLDNQVLINYITNVLNGVVGEQYAEPYGEGRIIGVPKKLTE